MGRGNWLERRPNLDRDEARADDRAFLGQPFDFEAVHTRWRVGAVLERDARAARPYEIDASVAFLLDVAVQHSREEPERGVEHRGAEHDAS